MRTALVTGCSRGVGRGVALALAEAGYTVFATGRSIETAGLPSYIRAIRCDHRDDGDTAGIFAGIAEAGNGLELLVNCAWGGYERMVEEGVFTWPAPFWEQPSHRWSAMMDAGVRPALVCSARAARMMIASRRGLIVDVSFLAARRRLGDVMYYLD